MSGEMLQKARPAGHRPALQRTCPCVTLLRNATLVELRTARIDHSEKAGAGGKIESILLAGAFAVPEADRPQSWNRDGRPVAVGEPAKRRTGRGIERLDVAVEQVPHQ